MLEFDGKPVGADDAKDPRLSGTYNFNGVTCRTAYDLLVADIMDYSPEAASKICDIPADTIIELANSGALVRT